MEDRHAFDTIHVSAFNELLAQYPSVVPEKVGDLEKQRLEVIPASLKLRKPPLLTKDELTTLMDWKLAHGKFRPTLKALIKKNTEDDVRLITISGFQVYSGPESKPTPRWPDKTRNSLKILTKLKGVGAATASLLLATYQPREVPFFSDELYKWAFWEVGKGKGWDRDLKYTAQEYANLCAKVHAFILRFRNFDSDTVFVDDDVSALDVEKVAYVLGKQAEAELKVVPKKRQQATKKDMEQRKALMKERFKAFERAVLGDDYRSEDEDDEDEDGVETTPEIRENVTQTVEAMAAFAAPGESSQAHTQPEAPPEVLPGSSAPEASPAAPQAQMQPELQELTSISVTPAPPRAP